MPHVTFVVATYRRADALRCTLEALCLQHYADWDALVVGDACDDATEAAVRAVADPRIAYYNLPERVGEQSGPNSVGMALARGEVLAFLNHDDLLFPDHLAYGLEAMGDADVFLGRGAKAERRDGALTATRWMPMHTDPRRLVLRWPYAFEPCSFWLVRTAYARRVGPWRPARTLARTPLQDWLLRAWGLGGTFAAGERLTGLKTMPHPPAPGDGPAYDRQLPENAHFLARLRHEPLDALRADLVAQVEASLRRHPAPALPWPRRAAAHLFSGLYRATGVDAIGLAMRARGQHGAVLQRLLEERTGEPLPEPPDLDALIARAPSFRVV